jgi:Sec-independent protein translocase protein TatA
MESVSLYSEARNEYLKQLSTWVIPPMVEFFRHEYSSIVARDGHKRAMAVFQEFCSTVPKWNQDIIESNVNTLLENCRCDYIEELMTAVFIAHTKMLTAIRVNSKQKKLQITLPKLDHFLHRIFIECARSFWKAPFLFSEELMPIERQKNILQLESMATEALSSAVRSLLPIKTILRDYMNDDDSSSEEEAPSKSSSKKSRASKAQVSSDSESSDSSDTEDEDNTMLHELKSDLQSIPPALLSAPLEMPTAHVEPVVPSAVDDLDNLPLSSLLPPAVEPSLPEPIPEPMFEPMEKKTPITIEKLDTPPEAPAVHESTHAVDAAEVKINDVFLQKDPELPTVPATNPNPPQLVIDTEPSVHFTPYDTVFDENKSEISEIRYAPKVSVEDKPPSNWGMSFEDDDMDDLPKLSISNNASSLGLDEIVDLDAPAPAITDTIQPDDIDEPLTISGDFEELA